jgi:predicted amidohydrolase
MVKIAVAQICSTPSLKDNVIKCVELMKRASKANAKALFLPEASDYITDKDPQPLPITGEFITTIQEECKRNQIFVSIGIHEKQGEKTFNSHVLIDDFGMIQGIYRKLHLFDVAIPNGPILMESKSTASGQEFIAPIQTTIGRIGLGICYDLRFPEFSTLLQKQGMDILTYPSAFTVKTGQAHWQVLLRARAIETQSYVIAAAQYGKHTEKRESYGHGMVINPWGEIIAECTAEEPLRYADIDLNLLNDIRVKMPVLDHRRDDIYSLHLK